MEWFTILVSYVVSLNYFLDAKVLKDAVSMYPSRLCMTSGAPLCAAAFYLAITKTVAL